MNTLAHMKSLRQQAAQLKQELAKAEQTTRDLQKSLRRAKLRALYFRGAQALRAPAADYSLWFPGVLIVGTVAAAAFSLVILLPLGLSATGIVLGMALAGAAALGLLAAAISSPATSALPSLLAEQQSLKAQLQQGLAQLRAEAAGLQQQISTAEATIGELLASDRYNREQLLKQNWKAMRGTEWEQYLVQVFEALGASAETNRTTGDQGVDLLVRFGEMMIAVQAKGYVGSVGNDAVQQVIAGKAFYGCDRAAVITNSRFTAPARSLAECNSCFLIGEKEFPAFVMGSNWEMFE